MINRTKGPKMLSQSVRAAGNLVGSGAPGDELRRDRAQFLIVNPATGQQSILPAGIVSNELDAKVLAAVKFGGKHSDYIAERI
jgi:hypothetical protein